MKRMTVLAIVLSIAFAWIVQGSAQELQGDKPYIPSRIEWLAVELNAMYRTDMTSETNFMLTFMPLLKEDTILIFVTHTEYVDYAAMSIAIDTARKLAREIAKDHGWDSWVKIRENVEMVKLPPTKQLIPDKG